MVYIAFLAKKKGEKNAFINNLALSIVFISSITVNLIIVRFFMPPESYFIVFPFDILMIMFLAIYYPLFYYLILHEKSKIRKRTEDTTDLETQKPEQLPFKYEIYRKLTHLVVIAIILFYFTLGFLIQNVFINFLQSSPVEFSDVFYSFFEIEGSIMLFTQYLVVFLVGMSVIGLLTADYIRILRPEIYPLKQVNQILREKELHMRLGPHISMAVGCFSVILIFGLIQPVGPFIICTAMTMSIIGDIAANLVGRGFGRNKIRDTNKTYEGLIGGIVAAFFSGIIILIILRFFFIINLLGFFLLPIIGAIIIGVIDYMDLEIDDNLSYNLFLAIVFFFLVIYII